MMPVSSIHLAADLQGSERPHCSHTALCNVWWSSKRAILLCLGVHDCQRWGHHLRVSGSLSFARINSACVRMHDVAA